MIGQNPRLERNLSGIRLSYLIILCSLVDFVLTCYQINCTLYPLFHFRLFIIIPECFVYFLLITLPLTLMQYMLLHYKESPNHLFQGIKSKEEAQWKCAFLPLIGLVIVFLSIVMSSSSLMIRALKIAFGLFLLSVYALYVGKGKGWPYVTDPKSALIATLKSRRHSLM